MQKERDFDKTNIWSVFYIFMFSGKKSEIKTIICLRKSKVVKTSHTVGTLEIAPEIVLYLEINISKIYFQDVFVSKSCNLDLKQKVFVLREGCIVYSKKTKTRYHGKV